MTFDIVVLTRQNIPVLTRAPSSTKPSLPRWLTSIFRCRPIPTIGLPRSCKSQVIYITFIPLLWMWQEYKPCKAVTLWEYPSKLYQLLSLRTDHIRQGGWAVILVSSAGNWPRPVPLSVCEIVSARWQSTRDADGGSYISVNDSVKTLFPSIESSLNCLQTTCLYKETVNTKIRFPTEFSAPQIYMKAVLYIWARPWRFCHLIGSNAVINHWWLR